MDEKELKKLKVRFIGWFSDSIVLRLEQCVGHRG